MISELKNELTRVMQMTIIQKIEYFIFRIVRWVLLPAYFYLIVTLFKLLYSLWAHHHLSNEELIHTLEAVDIVMIANVVKLIITGSYNSFVSKEHGYENENISSGVLKIKIATSILGVVAIHALQSFITVEKLSIDDVWKTTIFFGAFMLSSFTFAAVDYLHHKTGGHENEDPHDNPHTPLIKGTEDGPWNLRPTDERHH